MNKLKARIDELRKLEQAATPGPWETTGVGYHVQSEESEIGCFDYEGGTQDAEFIAASRTAIPQLIDALEEMRVALEMASNAMVLPNKCAKFIEYQDYTNGVAVVIPTNVFEKLISAYEYSEKALSRAAKILGAE